MILFRRLLVRAVTVFVILTIAFALLEALPGDPSEMMEDPSIRPEDRQANRRALALDLPAHKRYVSMIAHALRGDFGVSTSQQRPVAAVLREAVPPTLWLMGSALLIAFALGLFLGTRAAEYPRGFSAFVVRHLLPAFDALPAFWVALCVILIFSWKLGWLPSSGISASTGSALWGGTWWSDRLLHALMPVLVLAIPGCAPIARHHWTAMRTELRAPHVRTARALGLSETRVVWCRAGRVALQPALAQLGTAMPLLLGGAVVIEVIFSWPGLGRVHQRALLAHDVPLSLGGLVLIGILVVLGSLLADLAAAWADPRLRSERVRPSR